MKKIIGTLAILSAVLILGGCGSSGNNQTNSTANPSPTSQSSTPAANSTISVNIQNFAFNPETLTVKKGSTVTWTNNDSAPHTIKSATFNSSSLSKGDTFSFTFNETGTFDYSCGIHPSMLGKIVVE